MGERQRYRVGLLAHIVIYKMYIRYIDSDVPISFSSDDLKRLFSTEIPTNTLVASIERFHSTYDRKYIRRAGKKGAYTYDITPLGIDYVELELRRKGSPISYFHANGDDSLDHVAGIESPFMTRQERDSADQWVPLELDRGSSEFKTAEAAIEVAIETIERDNGFAANMPAERRGILQSLRDGFDWLKSKSPTKGQIESLLIKPLNWLLAQFPKTVMGEAAKRAVDAIWSLIRSFG